MQASGNIEITGIKGQSWVNICFSLLILIVLPDIFYLLFSLKLQRKNKNVYFATKWTDLFRFHLRLYADNAFIHQSSGKWTDLLRLNGFAPFSAPKEPHYDTVQLDWTDLFRFSCHALPNSCKNKQISSIFLAPKEPSRRKIVPHKVGENAPFYLSSHNFNRANVMPTWPSRFFCVSN